MLVVVERDEAGRALEPGLDQLEQRRLLFGLAQLFLRLVLVEHVVVVFLVEFDSIGLPMFAII